MKFLKIKIGVVAIIGLAATGAMHSAPRAPQSAQPTRSVWDGVYTAEQEKRGAEQYSSSCARCHGEDLLGVGEAAPLTGPTFLADWDGLTLGDLSERIVRTMPQDKPGTITRQQAADIMTHILSFDGFPAGKTELDPKAEVQNQIRFDAQKPKPKSDPDSHEK